MNNPHVERIYYRAIPKDNVDYDSAPPISGSFSDFDVSLEKHKVTFEMKTHFSFLEEARVVTDDFVKRWQFLGWLEKNPGELQFEFDDVDIIDRKPKKPDGIVGVLKVKLDPVSLVSEAVTGPILRKQYPSLPAKFSISPQVQRALIRYRAYCENQELLTTFSYWLLTVLEESCNRKDASTRFQIEDDVLDTLGRLSSTKGSWLESRKYPKGGIPSLLKAAEREWLQVVVKVIIKRLGEYEYDPHHLTLIRMNNLPQLN